MQQIKRVTVGTDPEFFLQDKKSKKKISAIPHIAGTKHEPVFLPNGSKVQHDNVALEFATPPATNATDLATKLKETFMLIKSQVPDHLEVVAEPSAIFEDDQLMDFEALQFGCDPDYNAWTLEMNNPPNIETKLRSCGGHLHVGHVKDAKCDYLLEFEGKVHTVRLLDAFHGIISVVLDSSKRAKERRNLYGKAGCYRPTPYGVEYRVMSNFWLKSPKTVHFVDSMLQDVINILGNEKKTLFRNVDKNSKIVNTVGVDIIQKVINDSNVEEAEHIMRKYLIEHMSKDTLTLLEEVQHATTHETFKTIFQEWS